MATTPNIPKPVDLPLYRGGVILTALFGLFIIVLLSALYIGVKNNELDKGVIKPLNTWWKTYMVPTPTLAPTPDFIRTIEMSSSIPVPVESPTPTPTTTPVVQSKPIQQVAPSCVRMNIREGEFASNKCYSQQDYDDLNYYLNQYTSAKLNVDYYQSSVNISCSNPDFFKNCDEVKQQQAQNNANIDKYHGIIVSIIARGR